MAVKWLPSASRDIEAIAAYIGLDNPKVAHNFVMTIRKKAEMLAHFPSIGRYNLTLGVNELVVHERYIITYRL